MSAFTRLGNRLYSGQKSINFVGRRWLWYAISGAIIIAAVLGLSLRGLNLGIDFKGGVSYQVTVPGAATQTLADNLRDAVGGSGVEQAQTPTVMTAGKHSVIVEVKALGAGSANDKKLESIIASTAGVSENQISRTSVGADWGSRVAKKALTGLIVFLILVVLFIWAYFRQWKMSVAAIVALAHDVIIAVGVYALVGFEVTPATVTGFLTILGFSLYDTVVVFDKVRENTKNLRATRQTYAQAANLALNQTLVRSINTSFVALLPVAAILWVSAVQLGSSSLKDIALALFVGMAAGTYSSIFIATPLLVHLKQGEKEVVDAERRAKARRHSDDRYADVPSFTEDMEVEDDPAELRGLSTSVDADGDEVEERPAPKRPVRNTSAMGSGRNLPTQHGEVRESGSSGRPQPSRQSKSKRK
jgi:preprotein translocase subunit SecF